MCITSAAIIKRALWPGMSRHTTPQGQSCGRDSSSHRSRRSDINSNGQRYDYASEAVVVVDEIALFHFGSRSGSSQEKHDDWLRADPSAPLQPLASSGSTLAACRPLGTRRLLVLVPGAAFLWVMPSVVGVGRFQSWRAGCGKGGWYVWNIAI